MVIGVHRRFASACARQRFIGDAGDNLIHIHVRLRAAARLPDDERELIVMLARQYGVCGGDDRVGNVRRQRARRFVR